MNERLSNQYESVDLGTLSDTISVLIANVENGILAAGGVAGVDYTFRDLVGWAIQTCNQNLSDKTLTLADESKSTLSFAAPATKVNDGAIAKGKILRLPEVIERCALKKASIYALVKKGSFVTPVRLSARAIGWHAHEIDQWIYERSKKQASV